MKTSIIVVISSALALSASPTKGTHSCPAGTFTDKFDDQKAANALTPELAAPVDTPYNGLKYTGVNVNNLQNSFLIPQSGKNVATLFITNNVIADDLSLNPHLTISALPGANGGARTFDLIDFYFGCIIPTFQTGVNLAGPCDISVTGVKANGERVGEVSFSFANTALTRKNAMERANVAGRAPVGDYVGLKEVNITITKAIVDASVGVLAIDNVRHANRC